MDNNTYMLIDKFECCGNLYVIVAIKDKAACVMTKKEYNKIIETEREFGKRRV